MRRVWADQISYFGTQAIIANNLISDGQDMGITVQSQGSGPGYNTVANNFLYHNGASAISAITSDSTFTGNVMVNNQWQNNCTSCSLGGLFLDTTSATRNVIANNVGRRTAGLARTLFAVRHGSNNTFAFNTGEGAVAQDFQVDGTTGDATNNLFIGNRGVHGVILGGVMDGTWQFNGGTPLKKHLSATASLDFAAWAGADCQDKTITVTGAVDGDSVAIGVLNALASTAAVQFTGFVSAANTVTVRGCKITSGASANPAAFTVRADVWQH